MNISEWTLIALFSIPFIAGILTGMKLMRMKMIIFLLKKLDPDEFQKLMENGEKKDENERYSATDIGKMSAISGGASDKYQIPSKAK